MARKIKIVVIYMHPRDTKRRKTRGLAIVTC